MYEGSGTFKTTFIQKIGEYIRVFTLSIDSLSKTIYDEWKATTQLLLIDENTEDKSLSDFARSKVKKFCDDTDEMHIKYVSNTQDVKTHYNVIMNSNYANFGGLFDNQTEDEMFRRFHIIEKQKVSKELTNKIYEYIHNKRVMDAIIVKIMNRLPLSPETIEDIRKETQQKYYNSAKDESIRKVLRINEIRETFTAHKKKSGVYIRMHTLIKLLKKEGYKTNSKREKALLLKKSIIKECGDCCYKITDIKEYYNTYGYIERLEDKDKIMKAADEAYNKYVLKSYDGEKDK